MTMNLTDKNKVDWDFILGWLGSSSGLLYLFTYLCLEGILLPCLAVPGIVGDRIKIINLR